MKHLFFDLDGTIIEPKEGIVNSIRHAADLMGAVMPSEEELHQFIGPPIVDSFQDKLKLSYEQALEAVSHFRCYYAETGIHQNALFTGIADVLHALKHPRSRAFSYSWWWTALQLIPNSYARIGPCNSSCQELSIQCSRRFFLETLVLY